MLQFSLICLVAWRYIDGLVQGESLMAAICGPVCAPCLGGGWGGVVSNKIL
jgi:hypothetical protein